MASKFGGGGTKCVVCDKTAYPAETVSFEKKAFHVECFRCCEDNKKITPSDAALYDDKIYCRKCFNKNGFAQAQRNVKWEKKESSGSANPLASKFGGGGTPCTVCTKTVYAAETVSFEKRAFHANCFVCSLEDCKMKLTTSKAASFEGAIICLKCFDKHGYTQKQTKTHKKTTTTNALASKFGGGGNKCEVCAKTVYAAETVSFEKKIYHPACFKCTTCAKKMQTSGANYFESYVEPEEKEGEEKKEEQELNEEGKVLKKELLCTKCFSAGGYRQKQAATAKKATGGGTVDARFAKFGGGGTKCTRCDKTVYAAEMVSVEKMPFHAKCLNCEACGKNLKPAQAQFHKGAEKNSIHCDKCFKELGLHRADAK